MAVATDVDARSLGVAGEPPTSTPPSPLSMAGTTPAVCRMNRRLFLGSSLAAGLSIFVPKYGQWYRQGSGILVPRETEGEWTVNYRRGGKVVRVERYAGPIPPVLTVGPFMEQGWWTIEVHAQGYRAMATTGFLVG